MTLLDVLILLLVAGICGSLGQAIAGYSRGGCLVSIALGFVGALLGMWIARLMGLPAPELEELEPEAYRRLLHETIASAITHLARSAPVVIAVEDLHWADASSIELSSTTGRSISTRQP